MSCISDLCMYLYYNIGVGGSTVRPTPIVRSLVRCYRHVGHLAKPICLTRIVPPFFPIPSLLWPARVSSDEAAGPNLPLKSPFAQLRHHRLPTRAAPVGFWLRRAICLRNPMNPKLPAYFLRRSRCRIPPSPQGRTEKDLARADVKWGEGDAAAIADLRFLLALLTVRGCPGPSGCRSQLFACT